MPKPLPIMSCHLTGYHYPHKIWFDGQDHMCPGVEAGAEVVDVGMTTRDAAHEFMRNCGLDPTPDAVGQLAEIFLPCLRIMCDRGYDPDGGTWRAEGWRGMLWKIMDKAERLRFRAWARGEVDQDSALDIINYAAFYLRIRNESGSEWGKRGEPGNDG